ncbi:formate--phosphoribosylaminoimidazolecarboxamide ligase [Methanococcus maripaludis]|uniref:5-formaminoimidazole-4-carboxamide-1-(beta)-D-ribofuranosyl 5'-monophosphate synthetase n=2 Tax=Methanococcus maripaludis TaxID=39152 RepID=PURP_METMP|nr:formate--phosphoribosylaminoimidazolecarboxamide ligase [Methanococcus maripaludis]Q6LXH8.1 RecName: Full=5-formaminoimidazole-4-carboxamide-1-(beta)-D-ribofuranosyl 5'-monophosphate synthetase; AltName: Full=5-aminoimidazole-4-carboxamide-1-beta-D-ribofuranosyl 5'-monophosphate--formate ligase [Methanococcus maripaludis S2]MBB6067123.1 5-formaminoimidazole-4-carboxamide-1-(beta)-D-ribofuranosyl 5'-monophosphate synthetase [Methanococcus maripaludis]MBM7409413.1 5-formaminoimidazole-4-carboxa
MIPKEEIMGIFEKYNKDEVTIVTVGSHTSLHILKGAKLEGFSTAVITTKDRAIPYKRFGVADKFIYVDQFSDISKEEIQQQLRDMNAIIVPHGSFIAYCGLDNVEDTFKVPMFGNRAILRWEAERDLEGQLLGGSGLRIPKKYGGPDEIDGPVMVKFPGARGGRGYFPCSSVEEFWRKIDEFKAKGVLTEDDVSKAHIEEYVVGANYCIHYFYSPLKDQVELMGIDRRYESSIDGLVRVPAKDQLELDIDPSYVITGNFPVVIRESLLPQVFDMGDKLVAKAKEEVNPGMLGPFCLQSLCNENLELVVFEMSARVDGGTNTFMNGSPYSCLYTGEPLSMGQRIAKEIKLALELDMIDKVIS